MNLEPVDLELELGMQFGSQGMDLEASDTGMVSAGLASLADLVLLLAIVVEIQKAGRK